MTKKFYGKGYWHEDKKWSEGKRPGPNDIVVLDEDCDQLTVGYNKSSVKYLWYRFRKWITFGLYEIPKYEVRLAELRVIGGVKLFLYQDITVSGSVTLKDNDIASTKVQTIWNYNPA